MSQAPPLSHLTGDSLFTPPEFQMATYEITCFDGGIEIGTFDFKVECIAVGTVLDEMIVTAVRMLDEESGMAEVEVSYL
jgi:hypothetical protein